MGDLKPIGSEKLSGDAKLKRILELTYYQSTDSKSKSSEIVKESKTGVYGIVKEKDGYYVKKGLTTESLDYIGGMFMKNKNKFPSCNEAQKKLDFLIEQELLEATKYVLKQNKPAPVSAPSPAPVPQQEAPAPMPTTDTAPPAPDAGVPTDTGVPPTPDAGSDENASDNPDDYLKIIQKMTGRLTQKLSTYQDKLESKDIKYVLNMVVAAIDLDKMDENDKEEILSKFEDGDEGDAKPTSGFPTDQNGETPAPQDEEMSEVDGIAKLDELINTPFEDDDTDNFEEFTSDDDDFLNDPKINKSKIAAKAAKAAKNDIKAELGPDIDKEEDIDNPLDAKDDFPIYKGEDKNLEEDPMSSQGQMPNLDGSDLSEEDPNDPTSGPEGPAEGGVKELDIDELTNMVNSSVKETLSKYFN
jgi:hypothetical protein